MKSPQNKDKKYKFINKNNIYVLTLILIIFFNFFQQTEQYSLCITQQSSCLICPIQCTKCNSDLTCTLCASQYYLSSSKCLSCPQYCVSCTSSSTCIQCKDPYVLNNGTCSQCVVNNALRCSNTVSAIICKQQYYVNQNYCSQCLLNCKTCTSSSTCTQCASKYYLNSTVLTCNPCIGACIKCNSISPTICITCQNGYQIDSDGNCNPITCDIINCQYCSSTNVCAQCSKFYYWTGSSCVIGASILCQYGSIGPLPSHCINKCSQNSYQSQSSSPFVCVPYSNINLNNQIEISQRYYYAFSSYKTLQSLGSSSVSSINLQSNGEYSYSVSKLEWNTLKSFYKIIINLKYIYSGSTALLLNISSISQSNSQIQSQNKIIATSSTAIPVSLKTYFVHSNNLYLKFNASISLIQLSLQIYKCTSDCLQCLNRDLCQYCIQPYYMLGYKCVANCTIYYHFTLNRTCLLNCPDGYYYLNNGTNNKFCQLCQSPCENCIDLMKCLTCKEGFYFFNYTCKTSCVDGYYKDDVNNYCQICISPCKTCLNKVTCFSCQLGYWNGSQCISVCPDGTYGNNITNICQNCSSNCVTCRNSSSTCTSCISTIHLHNRQCIATCPQTYYSSKTTPLTCLKCVPPCQKCTTNVTCLSCSFNYLYNFNCLSKCPDGYFQNLVDNTCTKCSNSCKTCSSLNICTSCKLTTECLYQGTCVSSCPSNYWYKAINSTTLDCLCTQCKYPCKQCNSETECLSCLQGYLYGTNCLTSCPAGYFKNLTSQKCQTCASKFTNCSQCTSQKCTLCLSNFYLLNGKCLSTCPTYYYASNLLCNKCIAPCLQCQSFLRCSSCIENYIYYNYLCISSCPNGKYVKNTSSIVNNFTKYSLSCDSCQSPCLYCQNSSTECTLCESQYYLYLKKCYANCSTITPLFTFYSQPVTSTCSKCLFPCKNCLNQYQCTSCMIGYLNVNEQKCEQCSIGTYPDNVNQNCQKCPVSCIICYSATFCTICNQGYYLYQNSCISNLTICQVNGYYGIGRICSLCTQPCKTCSVSSNNCTTCLSGYIYFGSNQCLIQCPIGYFRNSTTGKCDICDTACQSCLGTKDYCFSCKTKDGYKLYTAQMSCLLNCPIYSYTEGSFCTSCKYPCLQCNSQTSCLSCISGSLINNKCYSSCATGYFSNSSNICQLCESPCKQCSNTETNCTQCISSTYLNSQTKQCVSTCPSQTFPQKQSLKCIKCLGTCFQCQSHINCTSCKDGLYYFISVVTGYGQCVVNCPNGYYPGNNNSLNYCYSCKQECLTCVNANECLLCNNGKVMYQGGCLTECPQKMYNNQGVCQNCKLPCYNCSDTTTCTSCSNDSFLLVGSAQCIQGPMCPLGYFLLENQPKCNSICPPLYYHITTNRTCNPNGCNSNQFKGLDYKCYTKCPTGFIGNKTYFCIPCNGDKCNDGLFFGLKYQIRNDDLIVYLEFTQNPWYKIAEPQFDISPNIEYEMNEIKAVSLRNKNNTFEVKASTLPFQGTSTIIFHLQPNASLKQSYYQVIFSNFLQTFENPLQHSSSQFYLSGYDKYNNQQLTTITLFGIVSLLTALIGLVKNPFMTDYSQILFILALNNIHYPLHLRSFLQSTNKAILNQFLSVQQEQMWGKGKFAYIVNNGLLSNSLASILIVIIGFFIGGIGYLIMKLLKWYLQYQKVNVIVPANQETFIKNNTKNKLKFKQQIQAQRNSKKENQKDHIKQEQQDTGQKKQSFSLNFFRFLQSAYDSSQKQGSQSHKSGAYKFILLYLNRIIYFNYLPLGLFSMTQLSQISTSPSINLIASFLAVLIIILLLIYPYVLVRIKKQKFTFLYIRKLAICFSLIMSINYPAYCIGVISVCSIMAGLLIFAYKLQKWQIQYKLYSILEGLQCILMIGFAIFIMIGQGYMTQFKVKFGWVLIFLAITILLTYLLFEFFEFILWLIYKITGKNYIQKWIQQANKEDSDGTDSQTLNSSMKDHQQKKQQANNKLNNQLKKQDFINSSPNNPNNLQTIQQFLRSTKLLSNSNLKSNPKLLTTKQIGVSPFKQQAQEELYWNYNEDQSNADGVQQKDKSPPKMLIRCINQFSDFDKDQMKEDQEDRVTIRSRKHHNRKKRKNTEQDKQQNK